MIDNLHQKNYLTSGTSDSSRIAVEDLLIEDTLINVTDDKFNSPLLRLFDTESNKNTLRNSNRLKRDKYDKNKFSFYKEKFKLKKEEPRFYDLFDDYNTQYLDRRNSYDYIPSKAFSTLQKKSKRKFENKKKISKNELKMRKYIEKRKMEFLRHKLKKYKIDTGFESPEIRKQIESSASKILNLQEGYSKNMSREMKNVLFRRKKINHLAEDLQNPLRNTINSLNNKIAKINIKPDEDSKREDSLLHKNFLNKTYRKNMNLLKAKYLREKRQMLRRRMSMEIPHNYIPINPFGNEKVKLFYKMNQIEGKIEKRVSDLDSGTVIFNAILTNKKDDDCLGKKNERKKIESKQ